MPSAHDIKVGDAIVVRGGWGRDLPVQAVVLSVGEEGGEAVVDYFDRARGRRRWAYLDQVETA